MATMKVYITEYIRLPAFHQAIFIETADNGSGRLYHVTNTRKNLTFRYEAKETRRPEESKGFAGKYLKGTINYEDLEKVGAICEHIKLPSSEVLHGVPIFRDCRHWVLDALNKLRAEGILV